MYPSHVFFLYYIYQILCKILVQDHMPLTTAFSSSSSLIRTLCISAASLLAFGCPIKRLSGSLIPPPTYASHTLPGHDCFYRGAFSSVPLCEHNLQRLLCKREYRTSSQGFKSLQQMLSIMTAGAQFPWQLIKLLI